MYNCNEPNCMNCFYSWETRCDPARTSCDSAQQCRPGPEICITRPCAPGCRPRLPALCRPKCRPQPPTCPPDFLPSGCCALNHPIPDGCAPSSLPCVPPEPPYGECGSSWQEIRLVQLIEAIRRMLDSCRC